MSRVQLRLDDALNQGRKNFIGFHLSTFDIPRSATADIDKDAGLLTFNFKYLDDEPAGPAQRLDDDVSIDAGKHSGKLLSVRINIKRYPSGEVRVWFSKVIDDVEKALVKSIRQIGARQQNKKQNYQLIKTVIDDNRSNVETALSA